MCVALRPGTASAPQPEGGKSPSRCPRAVPSRPRHRPLLCAVHAELETCHWQGTRQSWGLPGTKTSMAQGGERDRQAVNAAATTRSVYPQPLPARGLRASAVRPPQQLAPSLAFLTTPFPHLTVYTAPPREELGLSAPSSRPGSDARRFPRGTNV